MKKIFSIVLFFISAGNCFAQQVTFQKTYGTSSPRGYYVQQTADSGYIITGALGELIKTDFNGNILWTKRFTNTFKAQSIEQTTDGGFIITGNIINSAGALRVFVIKTDFNGDTLWTKAFVRGDGCSVQQTSDGGYIITGWTSSFGTGNNVDVLLIKMDTDGDTLWTKRYGGINYDYGFTVHQTMDGGYVICGETSSFGAGYSDIYLIKTNTNGDTLWTKTFGGASYDGGVYYGDGNTVQQTTDGGYIITGTTQSFGAGGEDVYLIKTDFNGDTLWTKTFGGTSHDVGYSVQQTTDGGYIITGFTESFGITYRNSYLIKTDANGNQLWSKTYGGGYFDEGYSVKQTTDGGYIVSGYTGSFGGGGFRSYLIKTDASGNSGCHEGNPATISGATVTQVSGTSSIVAVPHLIVTNPPMVTSVWGFPLITLCSIVDINEITDVNFFAISPNPTTNNFTITFPNTIHKGSIEIYDVMGKKIVNEKILNVSQKEIYLKNIDAGIYFVEINIDPGKNGAGGERIVKKIVKE